ncbi:MAG: hypothetical protein AAFS10_27270 [Myxococcota bacterium]
MTSDVSQDDLETLNAQRSQIQDQITRTANSIRDVVVKDIPRFLERETRWRWLQHTDFAANMSDAQIRDLKAGIADLARDIAPKLSEGLSQAEPWLTPPLAEDGPNRSLEANPEVWAILQKAACQLSGLLERFDFPTDPVPKGEDQPNVPYRIVYRTPTYFLNGQYCPRLVETYWNHIHHLHNVEEAIQAIHQEAQRHELEARWNKL